MIDVITRIFGWAIGGIVGTFIGLLLLILFMGLGTVVMEWLSVLRPIFRWIVNIFA